MQVGYVFVLLPSRQMIFGGVHAGISFLKTR